MMKFTGTQNRFVWVVLSYVKLDIQQLVEEVGFNFKATPCNQYGVVNLVDFSKNLLRHRLYSNSCQVII